MSRTCVLLQFGLYTSALGGWSLAKQSEFPQPWSLLLLREHPCLALGWLPPACPPLPGTVGQGEGQLCRQNTAWCQVRCHLAGLSLCLSSLALSVQQGEVSSSTCSRGAGSAWAEVQAESVAGSRQRTDRDTGSAASTPSAGGSPAGNAVVLSLSLEHPVLAQDRKRELGFDPAQIFPAPYRKDVARRSRRSGNRVSWDQELSQGMGPHTPSTASGCSAIPL